MEDKEYIMEAIGGWWGYEPRQMKWFLARNAGKPVKVFINSPGGSIADGQLIYNMLKEHDGEVTTINMGVTASIGTLIFLAGNKRVMTTGSQLMIHKPSGGMQGDSDGFRHAADTLDNFQEGIIDIYVETTGSTAEVLNPLMDAETWMLPAQAKELGFATSEEQVNDEPRISAVNHFMNYTNTPQALRRVEPVNTVKPPKEPQANTPPQKPEVPKVTELNTATAAQVEAENKTVFAEIAKNILTKERERVQGMANLAENYKDAPEGVRKAVAAVINEKSKDPEANAANITMDVFN